jgi:hypothetical protein
MLLVDAGLQIDLARYVGTAELIMLPAANPRNVQPTDFDHADLLMRAALEAARRVLSARPGRSVRGSRRRAA